MDRNQSSDRMVRALYLQNLRSNPRFQIRRVPTGALLFRRKYRGCNERSETRRCSPTLSGYPLDTGLRWAVSLASHFLFFYRGGVMPDNYYVYNKPQNTYGFFAFVGDVFMTCITCGFWLIWIFVREMRKR